MDVLSKYKKCTYSSVLHSHKVRMKLCPCERYRQLNSVLYPINYILKSSKIIFNGLVLNFFNSFLILSVSIKKFKDILNLWMLSVTFVCILCTYTKYIMIVYRLICSEPILRCTLYIKYPYHLFYQHQHQHFK